MRPARSVVVFGHASQRCAVNRCHLLWIWPPKLFLLKPYVLFQHKSIPRRSLTILSACSQAAATIWPSLSPLLCSIKPPAFLGSGFIHLHYLDMCFVVFLLPVSFCFLSLIRLDSCYTSISNIYVLWKIVHERLWITFFLSLFWLTAGTCFYSFHFRPTSNYFFSLFSLNVKQYVRLKDPMHVKLGQLVLLTTSLLDFQNNTDWAKGT